MKRFLAFLLAFCAFTTTAAAESSNATSVPLQASIVDANGDTWTLDWATHAAFRNGSSSGLTNVIELWYLNHTVWAWTGANGWQAYRSTWQAPVTGPLVLTMPPLPTTPGLRTAVGPQTGVTCSGVSIAAGGDIQAAVTANPTNTVFCLAAGTYSNQTVTPKDGNQFIGSWNGTNGSVMDGAGTATAAFTGSANNVVIKNMIITNYNNATQSGMIQSTGSFWLLQWNEIKDSIQGAGYHVQDNSLVLANYVHDNAQEGYSSSGIGVVFDSNEIYNNNPTNVGWDGGEEGGGKTAFASYMMVMYNYSHSNGGSGFWTDAYNVYINYWYNKTLNNMGAGIEHEISYNASIIGNHLEGDGQDSNCPSYYVGCGALQIENSLGIPSGANAGLIEIANNYVKPGPYGRTFGGRQQDRGTGSGDYTGELWLMNVWVHNNTFDTTNITSTSNGQAATIAQDTGDTAVYRCNNILFDYNSYTFGVTTSTNMFWWNNGFQNWSTWQGYGQDVHSTAVNP